MYTGTGALVLRMDEKINEYWKSKNMNIKSTRDNHRITRDFWKGYDKGETISLRKIGGEVTS
jgi:hypothetical protein